MLLHRRFRHDRVAMSLAARADDELAALLQAASLNGVGVGGGSSIADVDGVPVFVKRVPITGRELAHPHNTANLFDLPVRWQYGMYRLAGPGFNAWRELAANQSVTDGVLDGEAESFPLLHHWRVLPGRPPVAPEHLDIDAVVAQFGGNRAVRARFEALAGATSSLVLFLEYLPDGLLRWLDDPVGRAATVERQLFEMVAFLRHREVLHLDGHFGNIRADDDRLYLVDFGLATSPRFDLSDAERDFAARNAGHDADYASMRLVNWLVTSVCGVPVPADGGPIARDQFVRRCATGDIPPDVPPPVAEIIARHAPAAARMNDFCWRLFDGDLHAEYPGPRVAGVAPAPARVHSTDDRAFPAPLPMMGDASPIWPSGRRDRRLHSERRSMVIFGVAQQSTGGQLVAIPRSLSSLRACVSNTKPIDMRRRISIAGL